jgi:hypothetical protein
MDTTINYNQKSSQPLKKHVFAGSLNTAQHNLDLAVKEIGKRIKSDKITLDNLFSGCSYTDKKLRSNYLEEFFPFVSEVEKYVEKFNERVKEKEPKEFFHFGSEEMKKYKKDLEEQNKQNTKEPDGKKPLLSRDEVFGYLNKMLDKILNNLRNEYSHYHHEKVYFEDEKNKTEIKHLRSFLDFLFLQGLIRMKKKVKNADYFRLLKEKYSVAFSGKVHYTDKGGREKEVTGKEKDSYIINKFFGNYLLRKDDSQVKDGKQEEELKQSLFIKEDEKYTLSNKGFVFFLSLFLTRRQHEEVMNHVSGFKGTKEFNHYLTRQVFSCFCFRDIRKSLRSDYSKDQLLMQMVEELNRCPKELYSVLPSKHQDEFIEDINEYMKENTEFEGSLEQGKVVHPVIRMRYGDKFPYFALRFIDEYFNFPSLRFQVKVGQYVKDVREKEIKGTHTYSNRIVKEELRFMGKLSEVEKYTEEYFSKDENKDKLTGWQKYPHPSYVIENNRIPVYLNLKGKDDFFTIGKEKIKYKDIAKWEVTEKEKFGEFINRRTEKLKTIGIDKDYIQTPNVYLSVYELPALLHELLVKKTPEETLEEKPKETPEEKLEEKLREKVRQQIQEIVSDSNNRKKAKIPKKLRRIDDRNPIDDAQRVIKDVETLIEENDKKLNQIEKELQTANYGTFNLKQRGEHATWLAYDIKRFCGKSQIKNLKGYQFSELQALLAKYDTQKTELRNFLKEELDVASRPFLKKSLQETSLEDFISEYLKRRKLFIEGLKASPLERIYEYLDKRKYKLHENREEYFKILFRHPVNLDRGVFSDKPTAFNQEENKLTELAEWFEYAESKKKQRFYDFERNYIFEKKEPTEEKGRQKTKPEKTYFLLNPGNGFKEQIPYDLKVKYEKDAGKEKKEFEEENRFIKDAYKNEKEIRRIQRNDVFVWEMIKKSLNELSLDDALISTDDLSKVWLTKAERDKISLNAAEQSSREKGDKSQNILNENYLLSYEIEVSIFGGKIKDKVKIKDIGKFRKYEKDERIKTMVQYYEEGLWKAEQEEKGEIDKERYLTKKEIDKERDCYDKIRIERIFEEVHNLEDKIYNTPGINKEDLKKEGKDKKTGKRTGEKYPSFRKYIIQYFLKGDDSGFPDEIENLTDFGNIDEKFHKAVLLVLIRNKFAHNQLPAPAFYKKLLTIKKHEKTLSLADYYLEMFTELQKN